MKEQAGKTLNIPAENPAVPGCTVSKQVYRSEDSEINYFSLASGTSISPESYEYPKLWMVQQGQMTVICEGKEPVEIGEGQWIVTEQKIPVGVDTQKGCIYVEIGLYKEATMNQVIKAGEVFKLAEMVPYQEGKIVNMDIASQEGLKFVVMSFDAGTGLAEHAAPGEALVFALEGEATIGYEGEKHLLKAGETFKFDKMGKHSVTADKRFKMALLLLLG